MPHCRTVHAPSSHQDEYLNHKMQHSVNLLAVCSAEKTFTYVFAGFPGSAHDARVFQLYTLKTAIDQEPQKCFSSPSYDVLGDSAFLCLIMSWFRSKITSSLCKRTYLLARS